MSGAAASIDDALVAFMQWRGTGGGCNTLERASRESEMGDDRSVSDAWVPGDVFSAH